MYKSMEKTEDLALLPKNESSINIFQPDEEFLKNPFGDDKGNNAFWEKVSKAYGDGSQVSWDEALNSVRADEFIQRALLDKRIPLVFLLEVIHDEFIKRIEDPRLCTGFIHQLTKLGGVILQKDRDEAQKAEGNIPPTYSRVLQDHPKKMTILHLLAERNLVDFAEIYISPEFYAGHIYVDSQVNPKKLPLECALERRHDDMASLLARRMRNSRVRALFQYDEAFDAKFKFADIIQDPGMQETVVAILDSCVNPDWPFVPTKNGEDEEKAWTRLQDKPLQYHFDYRLLDGDQDSEPAKMKDGSVNENFKHLQPSCLQLIIDSPHSDETISHPVVRVLVDRKWEKYGKKSICLWFLLYILFVAILGLALFLDDSQSPRDYSTAKDKARGVFEVLTILLTFAYFIEEIDQMLKEKWSYFCDKFNIFDIAGILLIFLMIPLRYANEVRASYGVGAAAFLINCLRVFKFFPAFRDLGVYSKTFAEIIRVDIVKFAKLFVVVMIGFTGCVFLAIKSATFPQKGMTFWRILLKEARGIAEGNPFADDYLETFDYKNKGIQVAMIILIVLNMGTIIVVLSNILIGQLSSRYTIAQEQAEIRYSIDKAKYITKVEKGRFKWMNLRIKNYIDGDYVADEARITELLTDWANLREKKSKESKEAIRELYARVKKL